MIRYAIFILLFILSNTFAQRHADTLGNASLKREDSTTIKITRVNINSDKSDFSPYVFGNQLLFVSGRNNDVGIQYIDVNGESEITDLYCSSRIDSIKYKKVRSFDPSINSKYYEGPFCFNKKGNIIYFTANDKKTSLLKIFKSEKIKNNWTIPEAMPFCDMEHSYCHPSLSPNEDFMVFSSNINAKKNKMDLYMSECENGIWSPAMAMNKKINDSANQVFPFIAKNNILYFSSDKITGLGGLDIYSINLNSDSSIARALPLPINSSTDDFGMWVDASLGSGYFSTNRNPRYKDDIYYFSKNIPDFSNWKKIIPQKTFCYTFYEEKSLSTKDTANLTYEWDFGDGRRGRGLSADHCFDKPGEYLVELNIIDKNSGEVFINETSSLFVVEKPNQITIDCDEMVSTGQNVGIGSQNCYLKGYAINKMYWSFGDGKYNSGSFVKHSYREPGTYMVEMGLLAKNLNSNKIEQFKAEKKIIVTNKK